MQKSTLSRRPSKKLEKKLIDVVIDLTVEENIPEKVVPRGLRKEAVANCSLRKYKSEETHTASMKVNKIQLNRYASEYQDKCDKKDLTRAAKKRGLRNLEKEEMVCFPRYFKDVETACGSKTLEIIDLNSSEEIEIISIDSENDHENDSNVQKKKKLKRHEQKDSNKEGMIFDSNGSKKINTAQPMAESQIIQTTIKSDLHDLENEEMEYDSSNNKKIKLDQIVIEDDTVSLPSDIEENFETVEKNCAFKNESNSENKCGSTNFQETEPIDLEATQIDPSIEEHHVLIPTQNENECDNDDAETIDKNLTPNKFETEKIAGGSKDLNVEEMACVPEDTKINPRGENEPSSSSDNEPGLSSENEASSIAVVDAEAIRDDLSDIMEMEFNNFFNNFDESYLPNGLDLESINPDNFLSDIPDSYFEN